MKHCQYKETNLTDTPHIPVLLRDAVDFLAVTAGRLYVDATFGRGGHTREILKRGGSVIAFDHDMDAIEYGMRNFVQAIESQKLLLLRENFEAIAKVSAYTKDRPIMGILADFGVSSPQIDQAARGFSFAHDAPLDMRMDDRGSVRAADLINALGASELTALFEKFAQEHHAKRIAHAIIECRKRKKIETTLELAHCIEGVVHREGKLHPATKVFQALRIAVNDELGAIERFLPDSFACLAAGGVLVTIAFHEGEDRLVKQFSKQCVLDGLGDMLTKKPIEPSETELEQNPRSRSAKLRALAKL